MTVAELRALLAGLPDDAEVLYADYDFGSNVPATIRVTNNGLSVELHSADVLD